MDRNSINKKTSKLRSAIMRAVKSSGNKSTELKLVKIFRSKHIKGWRRGSVLPGKPDFVFRDRKIAIFVDGCFWHGCPNCYRRPKTSQKYWDKKVATNTVRDKRNNKILKKRGWKVLRLWEHQIKKQPKEVARRVEYILSAKGES